MTCICKRTCTSDIALTQQAQNFMRDGVRHMSRILTFQLNQTTQDVCDPSEAPKVPEKSQRCLGEVKQGHKTHRYDAAGIQYISQVTAKSFRVSEVGRAEKCSGIPGCRAKEKNSGSGNEEDACGASSPKRSCTSIMRIGVTYKLKGSTEWIPTHYFSQTQEEGGDNWTSHADAGLSNSDQGVVDDVMGDESLWDSGASDSDNFGGDFLDAVQNNRSVRETMCGKLFELGRDCKSERTLSLASPTTPYPDKELCCDCV